MKSLKRALTCAILTLLAIPKWSNGADLSSRLKPTGYGLTQAGQFESYYTVSGPSWATTSAVLATPNGDWVTGRGNWIAPFHNQYTSGNAPGQWTYQTTFSLSDYDPSTAILTLTIYCDNRAEVKLNGATKFSVLPIQEDIGPQPYHEDGVVEGHTITTDFQAGNNTLTIIVTNDNDANPNPTGLLVTDISLTALASYTITVPASGNRFLAAWQFANRTVSDAFPNPPNGTRFEFNTGGNNFTTVTFSNGSWSQPSYTLVNGVAFYVSNPNAVSASSLKFFGDYVFGQSKNYTSGVNHYVGVIRPVTITPSALCYTPQDLDRIYKFDVATQNFSTAYWDIFAGDWLGANLSFAVGEGMIFLPAVSATWLDNCY